MSNRVATIDFLSDDDTKVSIDIFTTDHGADIIVKHNERYSLKVNAILGTGIKKIMRLNVNPTFNPENLIDIK